MKRSSPVLLLVSSISLFSFQAKAQTAAPAQSRPRTVSQVVQKTKIPDPVASTPAVRPSPQIKVASTQAQVPISANPIAQQTGTLFLSPSLIQGRINEAQRLLKSRPLNTAMTAPSIDFVTVAALDRDSSHTHLLTLSKQTFLTKGAEVALTSSLGTPVIIRIVRANGVNTALTIFTADGKTLVPLIVEYPIEHGGAFKEMAYYTSAHPALLSNDLVRAGQAYVRNMMDLAVKRLKDRGVAISPDIVNVATRLCMVEHIDHDRFRNENRVALYDEIYSLYALN